MRAAAAILIALAALCLQRAATLPWASVPATSAPAYEISPIGIRATEAAAIPDSLRSCRWWPKRGNESLCAVAPGGSKAFERLQMAYPLLSAGLWASVVALFLQVLRIPRGRWLRGEITWLAAGFAIVALLLMVTKVPKALALVAGQPARFGDAGFIFACAAALLATVSGVLAIQQSR